MPTPKAPQATQATLNDDLLGAVKDCDAQRIKALIKMGASPDAADFLGDTALTWAVRSSFPPEDVPSVAALAEMGFPNLPAAEDFADHTECLRALLDAGANPNQQNNLQRTPLMEAAKVSGKFTKILLKNKADPNIQDTSGHTALMAASIAGNVKAIKQLVKNKKTNIELKDDHERTALSWAVSHKSATAVNALIKANADVNTQDSAGRCPLVLAINQNDEDNFETLMATNPNLKIRDYAGGTIASHATYAENKFRGCYPFSSKLEEKEQELEKTDAHKKKDDAIQAAFDRQAKQQKQKDQRSNLRRYTKGFKR